MKIKITTPTVKTTHVPTITPTVTRRLFDDVKKNSTEPFPK